MDDVTWPKQTARLKIRPLEESDMAAMFGYRSLPEVARWIRSQPTDQADFVSKYDVYGPMNMAIDLDGQMVGDLYLGVGDAWGQEAVADQAKDTQAFAGWVLDPAHWGRGIAREAIAELLRMAFEDLGLHRVIAECFAANEPSWRLMELFGMRREGTHVQDSLHAELGWSDGYTYALLRQEWESSRKIRAVSNAADVAS